MGFTKKKKSMNLLTNLNIVLDEKISIYYNKVARNGPNKFNVKYFLENYLIKIMNFFAKKRSTKIKGNRFWVKMVFHEMVMQIGSGLSLSVTR